VAWREPDGDIAESAWTPIPGVVRLRRSSLADIGPALAQIDPDCGLVTSTTQDPGGLDLVTTTSYEPPFNGGYLRKTGPLAEDLVHYLDALSERGADLVPVDKFGCGRAVVSGQQRDALDRHSVRGQHRHEGMPHLPGHPVLP
jgi:hypothetical protein